MHFRPLHLRAAAPVLLAPFFVFACQAAKDPSSTGAVSAPAVSAGPSYSGGVEVIATQGANGAGGGDAAGASANVDEAALDGHVMPCDDFYQYACGGWQKATPIPDDQSHWFRSFNVISERNENKLREILESFAKGERPSEPYAKAIGDFYASCMDEDGIEKAGLAPVEAQLAIVKSVKDATSLSVAFAKLNKIGIFAPFAFSSGQDAKDATQVIGQVVQKGLGLPEREYYLADDAKKKEIRAKYQEHIERMFTLAGDKPEQAKKAAQTVFAVELALAKASMTKEDRRDPKKIYNRLDRAGLKQAAPGIAWDAYFKEVGSPNVVAINVDSPEFIKAVGAFVKSTPIADWKTYLRWRAIDGMSDKLPARFVDEAFAMSAVLSGQPKLPPRWKRCVRLTDEMMGEAVGRAFVKDTLGSEGKSRVEAMIRSIEDAMALNLKSTTWMDEPTRTRALEKLSSITNMVAFPEKWRNYDNLKIEKGNFLGNVAHAAEFEVARDLAKIGQPVDRQEWGMSPPTVNAYYDPSLNQMVFPAGILQPPFFANERAVSTNMGGIGMVMGHELTHGFDDEGRQFDARGNLTDWWSPSVNAEFDKRAACVEKQYSQYEIPGGDHVNGKLTLGENIADIGGLKLAYNAMHMTAAKAAPSKNGGGKFTPDQQFFIGFAQGWCANVRDKALQKQVAGDPHSPARYRVIGPIANSPEFAKAFSCKAGDKMVRTGADRCEVW